MTKPVNLFVKNTAKMDAAQLTQLAQSMGKVAVLFGGQSAERAVSLMSGAGVLEALRSLGVDAHGFDPSLQALDLLQQQGFNRAFIALHGRWGEDGCVQGALEMLKIPYTGPGVMASAICMDKITTKRLWQTRSLSTPSYEEIDTRVTPDMLSVRIEQVGKTLGFPLIMKAPHEGSTLGLAKVNSSDELLAGFTIAAQLDAVVLAEQFIEGRELTVAIIQLDGVATTLPVIEIRAPEGNYDFDNKYYTNSTQYDCPAAMPEALTEKIRALALNAFHAVGCSGWARADILLRHTDNEPFLLEINTSPGMTSHSLVPMAANAIGMSYAQLCLQILANARLHVGVTR